MPLYTRAHSLTRAHKCTRTRCALVHSDAQAVAHIPNAEFVRVKLMHLETTQPRVISLKMDLNYWCALCVCVCVRVCYMCMCACVCCVFSVCVCVRVCV